MHIHTKENIKTISESQSFSKAKKAYNLLNKELHHCVIISFLRWINTYFLTCSYQIMMIIAKEEKQHKNTNTREGEIIYKRD